MGSPVIDPTLLTDMAQYTGSLERIALGKGARKKEASARRAAIAEMIDIAYVFKHLSTLLNIKDMYQG